MPPLSQRCQRLLLNALPTLQKFRDGFYRHGKFIGTGQRAGCRTRTNVDRQHVEAERRPACAVQLSRFQIDAVDAGLNQPHSRHLCQRPQIDVKIILIAGSHDVSGQGAGVGRIDVAGDQRHFEPRHGFFCQFHQH